MTSSAEHLWVMLMTGMKRREEGKVDEDLMLMPVFSLSDPMRSVPLSDLRFRPTCSALCLPLPLSLHAVAYIPDHNCLRLHRPLPVRIPIVPPRPLIALQWDWCQLEFQDSTYRRCFFQAFTHGSG